MASIRGVLNRVAALRLGDHSIPEKRFGALHELYLRIERSGLFDPQVYLSQQEDVRNAGEDPWWHFLRHGLSEGRHFTSPESVAPCLAQAKNEFPAARADFLKIAASIQDNGGDRAGTRLRNKKTKIGVYYNHEGNFYMREIADLLHIGLQSFGIESYLRDEKSDKSEIFNIRVFVAPHEFFYIGKGNGWQEFASFPTTVLYNVEQVQTPWFCRTFQLLLRVPLVLDLNLQTAQILRRLGCKAIFFTPGYLKETEYTRSQADISNIELVEGYSFAKRPYDWREQDAVADRPIDVLFIGARTPYRDKSLIQLENISEICRFICAYREAAKPFTRAESFAAAEANWALSQRAKIVLNLHRDWLGYFEWSRIVLRGFWQGACVVTDPGLPNPVFESGVHYLDESPRHLSELIRWLLLTEDGRSRLDSTRRAGYSRAKSLGSMEIALAPVLEAFEHLLEP